MKENIKKPLAGKVRFEAFKEKPLRKGTFVEVEGDLLKMSKQGKFDFIGHGCNCFATMGAGIALPIGIMYPEAKKADMLFEAPSYMRLGNFSMGQTWVYPGDGVQTRLRIINFYSQFHGGPNLDKEALTLSLRKFAISRRHSTEEKYRIGLPIIGCGIAGGNWNTVKKIIAKELKEFDVTIVHFKE